MKTHLILSLVVLASLFFTDCKKDDQKTETIIERDTIIVTVHDTIIKQVPADSGTVIFLVRHAETEGGGSNPHLSAVGVDRAMRLAEILKNNPLEAVYSTDFFRTQETAEIVSDAFALQLTFYDPGKLNDLATLLIKNHKGGRVLVVGHSNTTPDLINILANTNQYKALNDTVYDNLFIVNKNNAESVVTHLKYNP